MKGSKVKEEQTNNPAAFSSEKMQERRCKGSILNETHQQKTPRSLI